jgi:hypothetical protein
VSQGDTDSLLKKKKNRERVIFDGLKIQLYGELLSFWLKEFEGDAERLELALMAAVPYIQQNSNRPLEAQVSAQLARTAGIKRDSDKRAAVRSPKRRSATPRSPAVDPSSFTPAAWDQILKGMTPNKWRQGLGPPPGATGCVAPHDLLVKYGHLAPTDTGACA